jgi:putative flavoprotein involved in K+ transport
MPSSTPPHVLVIGAGPAGLATAVCLRRRGVSHRVVERGTRVAAALRQVDPEMSLLSPTRLSRLPGMRRAGAEPRYLPFGAFVASLERYGEDAGVQVETGCEVVDVRRDGDGFAVRLRMDGGAAEVVRASHVVNATGIIGAPVLPPGFDPAAARVRWMHSLDVRTADLAAARRLVVVGGATSAAEVLERWLEVRRPDAAAWLSLRSRLRAVPQRILGVDVHYLGWLPERAPAWPRVQRALRIREPMLGLTVRRALRTGVVAATGPVARWADGGAVLAGGARITPDLVVFATGFRYAVDHLGALVERDAAGNPVVCCCRSTRTPRLFLLGARFSRTFASPYVRGIGRDACYVARRIAREAAA